MMIHRLICWFLLLPLLLQVGCVTSVPPPTEHQAEVGRVAVINTLSPPEIAFQGFPRSKPQGAAEGFGESFFRCMEGLMHGSCGGELCGAAVIAWTGVCGVAGVVGGGYGIKNAPQADVVDAYEQLLPKILSSGLVQGSLREQTETAGLAADVNIVLFDPHVFAAAQEWNSFQVFRDKGVDTLLEVSLTKISISDNGLGEPLRLFMQAHARLIRSNETAAFFTGDYVYQGPARKLAEWFDNQAQFLIADLTLGYQRLSAHIIDTVFRFYPFPDNRFQNSGLLSIVFGLAPIDPVTRGQLSGKSVPFLSDVFEWETVDSLQPTLSWQSFPRASDTDVSGRELDRIRNIRYDLIISREQDFSIVYKREGLPEAEHTLEIPLLPKTHYFWTVRAKFELNGRTRVTKWGTVHANYHEMRVSPSSMSYRFRTK